MFKKILTLLLVVCLVTVCGCSSSITDGITSSADTRDIGSIDHSNAINSSNDEAPVSNSKEPTFIFNNLSWDSGLDDIKEYYKADSSNTYEAQNGYTAYTFDNINCDEHSAVLTCFFTPQDELAVVFFDFFLKSSDDIEGMFSYYADLFTEEFGENVYSCTEGNTSEMVWYSEISNAGMSYTDTFVLKLLRVQYWNTDFVENADKSLAPVVSLSE